MTIQFESFLNPFTAGSLWNSYPLNPTFGTYQIPHPSTGWFPAIGEGFSAGCFMATDTDPPMQIVSYDSQGNLLPNQGPSQPDYGGSPPLTIPHWPASVVPAPETDGHADIYDVSAGIIHSFYKLKQINGTWAATVYGWSPINGAGWGDPAHYYQGARAAGVAPSAGIIRKHEAQDGDTMYRHALCMSLDHTAMKSPYAFPATAQDGNGATYYSGQIPMGSLLMLPLSFDASTIANLDLRKVAETLKVYGARIVDTNTGTPFIIYVEIGTGYNLMPGGWDNTVAADLMRISDALRVATANVFIPGNAAFKTNQNLNMISMRGPWYKQAGPTLGVFDSIQQKLIFPPTTQAITQANTYKTFCRAAPWQPWVPGKTYLFTVHATGGATLNFGFYGKNATGGVGDGQTVEITFPADVSWPTLTARSGVGPSGSTAFGTLLPK